MSCIICLTNEAEYKCNPCNHYVLCFNCACDAVSSELFKTCPLCRLDIDEIIGVCNGPVCNKNMIILCSKQYPQCNECCDFVNMSIELRTNMNPIYRDYDIVFLHYIQINIRYPDDDYIKKMSSMLSKQTSYYGWINIINSCLEDINFFNRTKTIYIYMFTVQQLIQIHDSMKNITDKIHYSIYNTLSRLCVTPWILPVSKFSHGVCYHGNLGQKPLKLDTIKLLKRNYIINDLTHIPRESNWV